MLNELLPEEDPFADRLDQAVRRDPRTAKSIAAACGMSQQSFSAYRHGDSWPSTANKVRDLCLALGVSADWLFALPWSGDQEGGAEIQAVQARTSLRMTKRVIAALEALELDDDQCTEFWRVFSSNE